MRLRRKQDNQGQDNYGKRSAVSIDHDNLLFAVSFLLPFIILPLMILPLSAFCFHHFAPMILSTPPSPRTRFDAFSPHHGHGLPTQAPSRSNV
jgi:hypothetical protein